MTDKMPEKIKVDFMPCGWMVLVSPEDRPEGDYHETVRYIRADSEVLKRVVSTLQFAAHELHDLCDDKELEDIHQALADLKEMMG